MARACFILFAIGITFSSFSQTQYATIASGSWTDPSIWSPTPPSGYPTASDGVIVIQALHTVTVPSAIALHLDETIVNGTLDMLPGSTIFIDDGADNDLVVNGTCNRGDMSMINAVTGSSILFTTASTYNHNYTNTVGTLPIALWDVNATININGFTTGVVFQSSSGWSQAVGNINYQCIAQTDTVNFAGMISNVKGNFTVLNTGTGIIQLSDNNNVGLTFEKNLEVLGASRVIFSTDESSAVINIHGDFHYTSTNLLGSQVTTSGKCTINVGGDFNMNTPNGMLSMPTIQGEATLNIAGNFSLTAGRLDAGASLNGSKGNINFTDGTNSEQSFYSSGIITGDVIYSVQSGATLRVVDESALTGGNASIFNLYGTLIVESQHINGAIQIGNNSGNIRTSVRNYNGGSTIIYGNNNGAQVMGNGQPGSSGAGATSLSSVTIIDNDYGVTLNSIVPTVTVGGSLTVLHGNVLSENNILIVLDDLNLINGNLTIDTSNPILSAKTLTVNGNLNLAGGALHMISGTGNGDNSALIIFGDVLGSEYITFAGPNCRVTINGTLPTTLSRKFPVNGPVVLEQLTINRPGATLVMPQNLTLGNTKNTNSGLTLTNGNLKMESDLLVTMNTVLTSGTLFFEDHTVEMRRTITSTNQILPKPSGAFSCNENSILRITGTYKNVTVMNNINFLAEGNSLGILELNRSSVTTIPHVSLTNALTITKYLYLTDGEFFNGSVLSLSPDATLVRTANGSFFAGSAIPTGSYSVRYTNGLTPIAKSLTTGLESLGLMNDIVSDLTDTLYLASDLQMTGALRINTGVVSANDHTLTCKAFINNGTLLAPLGLMNVSGSFTNHGNFNAGRGTVHFNGSIAQVIQGTAVTDFNDILVSNTSATGLSIETNQNLKGTLTLYPNATVDADGSLDATVFTLQSGSDSPTADAAIATLPQGAKVVGNVRVQRFMAGEGRIYRYISSPVANATVAEWMDDFPITGNFNDPTNPTIICGKKLNRTSPSLFFYDETRPGTSNEGYVSYPFKGNYAYNSPLKVGLGYVPFIQQCQTETVEDVTGIVNQGIISMPVTYTKTHGDSVGSEGWNLIGNPYPSAIRWNKIGDLNSNGNDTDVVDGWTRTNISQAIAIRDNGTGRFHYWDGEIGDLSADVIASGQAFWVRATGADPTLIIREGVKTSDQGEFFRKAFEATGLMIYVSKGNTEDRTYLKIQSGAKQTLDDWDAPKLNNDWFDVSTLSQERIPLAINALSNLDCSSIISIHIANMEKGNYAMQFTGFGGLSTVKYQLQDRYLNQSTHLEMGEEYTFVVSDAIDSKRSDRFSLSILDGDSILLSDQMQSYLCNEDGAVVIANAKPDLRYTVRDTLNNLTEAHTGIGSLSIPIHKELLFQGINTLLIQSTDACDNVTSLMPLEIEYDDPQIIAMKDTTVCAPTSIELHAAANISNASVRWFDSMQGDGFIYEGNVFKTPRIAKTKQYFVSATAINGGCESAKVSVNVNVVFSDTILFASGNILKTIPKFRNPHWYYEGNLLTEVNSDTLIMAKSGRYTVKIEADGCNAEADYNFIISGVEKDHSAFTIYPNPVKDVLYVEMNLSAGIIKTLDMANVVGQQMPLTFIPAEADKLAIDVSAMVKGTYILKIQTTKGQYVMKIIK